MTITPYQMYWLVKLDNIQGFLGTLAFLVFALGAVFTFRDFGAFDRNVGFYRDRWLWVFSWIPGAILGAVAVLIPSTKQMAAIVIVPAIVNNQKVQELPNKLLDLGYEWIEDLKPKKGEKK